MKKYDIMMIGHISKDIMIDYLGNEQRLTGGPVVQSSAAAVRAGAEVLVVSKAARSDEAALEALKLNGADWLILDSPQTTSIKNVYHTENQERRDVSLLSQAGPFRIEEVPRNPARMYHLAGLFRGELPDTLIRQLSKRGAVAVDAQGLLRCSEGEELFFRDWDHKLDYLPMISYFKVDAAEGEILTGERDRAGAARRLSEWGATEVMLTHNSEVLLSCNGGIYRCPYTNRSFVGRTGRGDTTFAAYLAWRIGHSIEESLCFAAALCSIKMESSGPFQGTVEDVLARMKGS